MDNNYNNNESKNDFEFESDKRFNYFIRNYGGLTIGAVIAAVLCFTELYKLLVYVSIIFVGAYLGNYIQKNKPNVKEKLKEIIDRF